MVSDRNFQITVINGNTCVPMTHSIDQAAQQVRSPQTQIVTVQPKAGPESIECYYDEYLAIPGILEQIVLDQTAAGFILACWGDPGIEAAREITDRPVIGIAEASMYIANMLAAKWSVVTTTHRVRHMVEKTVEKTGIGDRCASVRTTNLAVVDTEHNRAATLAALVDVGQMAIEQDGAEALCLGCAGMNGLDIALEEKLQVPVIDSVTAAVKLAESIISLGKCTSKRLTYRRPELKSMQNYPDYMQPQSLIS
ncbi:MAG: aspartate/glutamate racemase family protein [Cyanobacteria bacterium P01_A01_bin.123]